MPDPTIDQEARDLVRDVSHKIDEHVSLCTEREKRRERVELERERRHDEFLDGLKREMALGMERLKEQVGGLQRFYEQSASDQSARIGELSVRHSNAMAAMAGSVQAMDTKVDGKIESDRKKYTDLFRDLFNRFWGVTGTLILVLVGAIGFLLAPFFLGHR